MRNRIPKVVLTYYVNIKTLERIHQALEIPFSQSERNGFQMGGGEEEDGEIIDEAVVDEGDWGGGQVLLQRPVVSSGGFLW